jgi:SAM-dependent methyltransferase
MNNPKSKFFYYEGQIRQWMRFFEDINKNKKILDFGTGPGWAVFVGQNMGFDIVGIDLDKFKWKLSDCLNVTEHIILYRGSVLPFKNKVFDLILCKAVLNKKDNLEINNRQELQRILKVDGFVLVAPSKDLKYLKTIKNKSALNIKVSKNTKLHEEGLYKELCKFAKSNIDSVDWEKCIGYIDCIERKNIIK